MLSWWVAQLLHLIMKYVFLEFWIWRIYSCLLDLDGNLVIKLVELVTSPLSPIMILLNVPLVRILIYVSPSPVVILFFLCVPCKSPFICTTSPVVILFYVSLFPYYYFHWMHIAHVTILLLLISVLYTAHSLMTTNACWLYSMHATCFTAFSLYATCILHFLCIQCFTMHPCWFIHLQPHVMVCTLKIFWEMAHVLTRRDTLLSKDVYILCSGAVPVGWLEDPEGYLARRSPD